MKSQRNQILNYLESGQSLTSREAQDLFGCDRLSARVHELIGLGYKVESRRKQVPTRHGKTHIAEYSLRSVDAA